MAVTAARDGQRSPGDMISLLGTSGSAIYAGTLVLKGKAIDEYTHTAAAGASTFESYVFAGVAVDTAVGTSAFRVYVNGEFTIKAQGTPALTHLYRTAYMIDNETVGVSVASKATVGLITGVDVAGGTYRVLIDRGVGNTSITGL